MEGILWIDLNCSWLKTIDIEEWSIIPSKNHSEASNRDNWVLKVEKGSNSSGSGNNCNQPPTIPSSLGMAEKDGWWVGGKVVWKIDSRLSWVKSRDSIRGWWWDGRNQGHMACLHWHGVQEVEHFSQQAFKGVRDCGGGRHPFIYSSVVLCTICLTPSHPGVTFCCPDSLGASRFRSENHDDCRRKVGVRHSTVEEFAPIFPHHSWELLCTINSDSVPHIFVSVSSYLPWVLGNARGKRKVLEVQSKSLHGSPKPTS